MSTEAGEAPAAEAAPPADVPAKRVPFAVTLAAAREAARELLPLNASEPHPCALAFLAALYAWARKAKRGALGVEEMRDLTLAGLEAWDAAHQTAIVSAIIA